MFRTAQNPYDDIVGAYYMYMFSVASLMTLYNTAKATDENQ
jgi:hypothetical protein